MTKSPELLYVAGCCSEKLVLGLDCFGDSLVIYVRYDCW